MAVGASGGRSTTPENAQCPQGITAVMGICSVCICVVWVHGCVSVASVACVLGGWECSVPSCLSFC